MGVVKIKDDQGNWVPIEAVIKPVLVPTLINTPSYSVPASGGDFWVDTTAATVNVLLPPAPANNTIVSVQIVDNGTAELYLTPTIPDTIAFQPVGISGKFAGTNRNAIETLRYFNGRWLPYYGRLAFVSAIVDPYFANVVFQAVFEGVNNATTFVDAKGNLISSRSGTPRISTAQSLFGSSSLYLDGSSSLVVPASPSFGSGLGDFEIEIAVFPTAFTAGNNQGLFDRRVVISASTDGATFGNTSGLGYPNYYNGVVRYMLAPLRLNQWQIVRFTRYQGVATFYLDDIPVYSGVDTVNYVNSGDWIIGDIMDVIAPNSGMFIGHMQYITDTKVARSQGYQSGKQTFSRFDETDPLEAFKVLDINCDTGVIVDTKGNSITLGGTPTASTLQKRSGSHSLSLNGFQHLDVTVPGSNFGTLPYTISTSFRFNSVGSANNFATPNLQYLFDCGAGNTSAIDWYGANDTFALVNAGANQVSINQAPVANVWYDAALLKVDTKYMLLLNNQIVAAGDGAPASVNLSSSAIRIGRDKISGNAGLTGFIDNFRVYSCANGSNLTHAYPLRFLARFSGSASDELGAVATVVGTAPVFDTANKRSLNSSGLFNGTGYYTYPASSNYDFGAGGFEIAGWIISSITQNTNAAIMAGGVISGTYDSQSWILYNNASGLVSTTGRSTTGKLSLFINAVFDQNAALVSLTSINDNQPHYFRIIKYMLGATAATVLIVDGKIEDVYLGNYTIAATTRPLTIGVETNAAGRIFKGNLDDIAIYTQYYFNGSNYQTLPSDTSLNCGTGDFLINGIFSTTPGTSTGERNIIKAPGGSNGLAIKGDRRLSWWMDGVGELITGTPDQISEGAFHSFSISRSGSTTTIRVDSTVYATVMSNNQSYDFRGWTPGSGVYNNRFIGYISDLYITPAAIVGSATMRYL